MAAITTITHAAEDIANTYDPKDELPLRGYVTLVSLFTVGVGASMLLAKNLPRRPSFADVILLGIATHEITSTVSKDKALAPLRAPFARFEKTAGAGTVKEKLRPGLPPVRRAIGELLECQYCLGPWVAAGLTLGLRVKPRATRAVAALFATVTVSNFLHQAYAAVRKLST